MRRFDRDAHYRALHLRVAALFAEQLAKDELCAGQLLEVPCEVDGGIVWEGPTVLREGRPEFRRSEMSAPGSDLGEHRG